MGIFKNDGIGLPVPSTVDGILQEECGWIYLLEKDGQHYLQQGGYSVMAEDNTPFWNPWRLSEEEALDEMISWESQG